MSANALITLTTDFGTSDPYAAIVKGVILGIHPDARIVDLTHQIPPHDITAAAWTIKDSIPFFPEGTVHMAVVDPGVGSKRRGIALSCSGHLFVGPDNGIFSAFLPADIAITLNRTEYFLPRVSETFHARDVFAPVAARLASGMPITELGDPVTNPVTLSLPEPIKDGNTIKGQVVQIDRFGNLITNIPRAMLDSNSIKLKIKGNEIDGIFKTYSDIPSQQCAVIVGSTARLEIAMKNGSAKNTLNANTNDRVTITIP